MAPKAGEKIIFWVIVGMISVFFAEVISGSTPYPFFTPLGWLIVFPVYELHIFVLGSVVLKYGKPSLYALYPAGMIFGMYESYITKVIWGSASWGNSGPNVGGIYLIPFVLVVLFWHPFMSFIIPLTVSEIALTNSRKILSHLPFKITYPFVDSPKARRNLVLSAMVLGLMGMFNLDALNSFLSSFLCSFFLLGVVVLWRKRMIRKGRALQDYLPGKMGFTVGLILLALLYIFATFSFNPQYLPPVPAHIFTLLIYAFLMLLLWRNLKVSRKSEERGIKFPKFSLKFTIFLILIFVLTTTLESMLFFRIIIFAVFLILEGIIGFACLIYSVIRAIITQGNPEPF